jgi:hypothetical protein
LAFFFQALRTGCIERLSDRITLGVDPAQDLDPPLRMVQKLVALPEKRHPTLVLAQAIGQPKFALLQSVHNRFQLGQSVLETGTGSGIVGSIVIQK